jgi:hypothetical protein
VLISVHCSPDHGIHLDDLHELFFEGFSPISFRDFSVQLILQLVLHRERSFEVDEVDLVNFEDQILDVFVYLTTTKMILKGSGTGKLKDLRTYFVICIP